jgi:hypothetical protein
MRLALILFAGVGLACSAAKDDSASGTEPATTGSQTTGSSLTTSGLPPASSSETGGSTTQAAVTTDMEDPTSAGPTASSSVGETGSSSGTPGSESESESSGEPGTTDTGTAVTFMAIYEQVILPNGCNAGYCHGGGAGGLEMTDEATTYANLVEVAASTAVCGQTLRVSPGSLAESILWYRVRPVALDGGDSCAPKMPMGSMGLTEAEAQLVDDWISGGALE